MDTQQNSSLFDLNLGLDSRSHLTETAKWAKFLAICGMIFIVLMVILGFYMSFVVTKEFGSYEGYYRRSGAGYSAEGLGATMMIVYILFGLLYFFPCLFTLQFANKMKTALATNDSIALAESFRSLKKTFRYMGVLTIIALSFMALGLITGGLTALTS